MALSPRDVGVVEYQDLLLAMLSWKYREYARRCSSCYYALRFLEMAIDEDSLSINDRQRCSKDTCRCVRVLIESHEQVLSGCVLEYARFRPFVRYATEVEYDRRMHKMLGTNFSSDSDVVDFSCCFLPRLFRFFYLIRNVDTWGRDMDFNVRRRSKGLLVSWHNIKLFAVPRAR